jgi:hypothetical protein
MIEDSIQEAKYRRERRRELERRNEVLKDLK